MTIQIYKNYGCLAAEKRAIYTFGGQQPTAVCSDIITVKIPDGWNLYKNIYNETLIETPWGCNYDINDILYGNETPYFAADKDGKYYRVDLEIVKTES